MSSTRASRSSRRQDLQKKGVDAADAAQDNLADAAQLEKVEAAKRNKCRVLAKDFNWEDVLGITPELIEFGKSLHDLVASGDVEKLTKKELQQKLEALDEAYVHGLQAEQERQKELGPANEGGRYDKGDAQVANRAANAAAQADAKGMSVAEKEAHIAAAVAKELGKQKAAMESKEKDLSDKANKAAADKEVAEAAVAKEREEKAAAEAAAEAAAKEAEAAAKAALEAEKAKTRAAKQKAKEDKERLEKELAQAKAQASKAPSEKGGPRNEDGESDEEGPESGDESDDEPAKGPKKKAAKAPKKKAAKAPENNKAESGSKRKMAEIVADGGEEAWQAEKQRRKEAAEAAANAKRQKIIDEHNKEQQGEKMKEQAYLEVVLQQIKKQEAKLDESQKAFNIQKNQKKALKTRAVCFMDLAKACGATPDQIQAIIEQTPINSGSGSSNEAPDEAPPEADA